METTSTQAISRVRHFVKVVFDRGALEAFGKGGLHRSRVPECLRNKPGIEYRDSQMDQEGRTLLSINMSSGRPVGYPSSTEIDYGGPFLEIRFPEHAPWTEVREIPITTTRKRIWPFKPEVIHTIERREIEHIPSGPFLTTVFYSNPNDLSLGTDHGGRGVFLRVRLGIPEEEGETFVKEVSANPNLIRYFTAFFFPTEMILDRVMSASSAEVARFLIHRPGIKWLTPQDIPFTFTPPDPNEFQKLLTDPVL